MLSRPPPPTSDTPGAPGFGFPSRVSPKVVPTTPATARPSVAPANVTVPPARAWVGWLRFTVAGTPSWWRFRTTLLGAAPLTTFVPSADPVNFNVVRPVPVVTVLVPVLSVIWL